MTPRWRTRNELPVEHVLGEVLIKVDHGGACHAHEIVPFAFSRGGVEWRERNSRHWKLVAWAPMSEVLPMIQEPAGGAEEGE